MEVHELVEGYYTAILNKEEEKSIATLSQAWDVHGVDVITWMLVRAIEDGITALNTTGKPRKEKKH